MQRVRVRVRVRVLVRVGGGPSSPNPKRLGEQVESVLGKAKSALVVGGGLTGIELAAELAEYLGDAHPNPKP